MPNPWTKIDINTYESHMSLNNVYQLQTMNQIMRSQFCSFSAQSIMILGIAGGNGLEHIDPDKITTVYGVDINKNYLTTCKERYPALNGVLQTLCIDLTHDTTLLPHADLLIANLLIEYIGYEWFQSAVKNVHPKYVSCVIQVNKDENFVSDSPYIHAFDHLDEVLHSTEETKLIEKMHDIGYQLNYSSESELPNEKKLIRIDFTVIS